MAGLTTESNVIFIGIIIAQGIIGVSNEFC